MPIILIIFILVWAFDYIFFPNLEVSVIFSFALFFIFVFSAVYFLFFLNLELSVLSDFKRVVFYVFEAFFKFTKFFTLAKNVQKWFKISPRSRRSRYMLFEGLYEYNEWQYKNSFRRFNHIIEAAASFQISTLFNLELLSRTRIISQFLIEFSWFRESFGVYTDFILKSLRFPRVSKFHRKILSKFKQNRRNVYLARNFSRLIQFNTFKNRLNFDFRQSSNLIKKSFGIKDRLINPVLYISNFFSLSLRIHNIFSSFYFAVTPSPSFYLFLGKSVKFDKFQNKFYFYLGIFFLFFQSV